MKQFVQKRIKGLAIAAMVMLSGCYTTVVTTIPGPPGPPGRAFFAMSYDVQPPYSYWDNNASVPYNPPFDTYFESAPGVYDFEYFINCCEYWYGTYEVWVNAGYEGCDCGDPGLPGEDNYFTLVCDPQGFYESVYASYKNGNTDGPLVIEKEDGPMKMRITIQKAHLDDRPAQKPKWKNSNS